MTHSILNRDEPLITWTRSQMRAMRALHQAGEQLEHGSRAEALEFILQCQLHLIDLQRFLAANPTAGRRP